MQIQYDLLIAQLREGNGSAFALLYDIYSKPLYRNLLRLVKDEDIAQELLQDLFLKIWENRDSIKLEGSFKSFLYKIAENLVYSHFRKVAKDKRLTDRLIQAYEDFDTYAEEVIISKENHQILKMAIAKLPPQRKQIYTLCKLEGKSYKEVSEQLGISASTIRNQIIQANKDVKQFFALNQNLAALFVVSEVLRHLM